MFFFQEGFTYRNFLMDALAIFVFIVIQPEMSCRRNRSAATVISSQNHTEAGWINQRRRVYAATRKPRAVMALK